MRSTADPGYNTNLQAHWRIHLVSRYQFSDSSLEAGNTLHIIVRKGLRLVLEGQEGQEGNT